MTANYHTHTFRCHHAKGTEREYIENAIKSGFKVLGFSDHSPYVFTNGYVSGFRMLPSDAEGYFKTITDLKEEYKDDIEIHVGVEMEYYPEFFEQTLKFLTDFPCEYIINGQHMLSNEYDENKYASIKPTDDPVIFRRYIDQVTEGMKTGVFSYLAHPDLLYYTGNDGLYRKYYTELCETAKSLDIPLEYNLLGLRTNRNYPNQEFWKIAAETGNKVIIGQDAHEAEAFLDMDSVKKAENFLNSIGITPIDRLSFKKIKI